MVDGKTQLFADLMIWNLEWIAIAAAGVFVVMLGVLAFNHRVGASTEEPSD